MNTAPGRVVFAPLHEVELRDGGCETAVFPFTISQLSQRLVKSRLFQAHGKGEMGLEAAVLVLADGIDEGATHRQHGVGGFDAQVDDTFPESLNAPQFQIKDTQFAR